MRWLSSLHRSSRRTGCSGGTATASMCRFLRPGKSNALGKLPSPFQRKSFVPFWSPPVAPATRIHSEPVQAMSRRPRPPKSRRVGGPNCGACPSRVASGFKSGTRRAFPLASGPRNPIHREPSGRAASASILSPPLASGGSAAAVSRWRKLNALLVSRALTTVEHGVPMLRSWGPCGVSVTSVAKKRCRFERYLPSLLRPWEPIQ